MALLAVAVKKLKETTLALLTAKGDTEKTTLALQQRCPLVVGVGTGSDTRSATLVLLVAKVGTTVPELANVYYLYYNNIILNKINKERFLSNSYFLFSQVSVSPAIVTPSRGFPHNIYSLFHYT